MAIRILCVDDHALLRAGVIALLDGEPGMTVVGEAASAEEALVAVARLRPDVVLMDLQLPGMDGIAAIAKLRECCPAARCIVLTTFRGDGNVRSAMAAGAAGYLLKSALRHELLAAIRQVAGGGRHLCAEVCADLAQRLGEETLTPREMSILQRLCEGLNNHEIAARLGISTDTVKTHLTHVFGKLGARNRTEAMAIAGSRGLLGLRGGPVVPHSR